MSKKKNLHIAVAGNIGAGKTTLVNKLAQHYGWDAHFEAVEDNPYLEDFYENMATHAFPLQIYFLHSRFNQIREILETGTNIIQDRTIFEDAHIFAKNLYESGYMNKRDYENYFSLFKSMTSVIKPPDLLIYLQANIPVLMDRIAMRGRDYEEKMSIGYLEDLNRHYEHWISGYNHGKLLIFNVNEMDYVARQEDFSKIVQRIDASLHGLFSGDGNLF